MTINTICNCTTCLWNTDCTNTTWKIDAETYDERFHCRDYSPIDDTDLMQDYDENVQERECYYRSLVRQFQ